MKLFGFAAVLTGIVLVTLNARFRRTYHAAPGLKDTDRRYGIDEFMAGLD
jgi:hypothetical protein